MRHPTEIHPGLLEERLIILRAIIASARHRAIKHYHPSLGDNAWTLGCRCYRWECHDIVRATDEHPEWLGIVEGAFRDQSGRLVLAEGLHFVFSIAGVPLRFYKGEPDDVPARSLRRHHAELSAQQTAFAFVEERKADSVLRIALETDLLGELSSAMLVQVDADGEPIGAAWTIPAGAKPEKKIKPFRVTEKPKKLGLPLVEPRKKPEERHGDE